MPLHVRVELPDRPGALASVARTVAVAGGDIRSIRVLHAEQGRAVDELVLDWPAQRRTELLEHALGRCTGVVVLGLRTVAARADSHDVDVVLQLLANRPRAFPTVVDALPGLLLADWAALVRRDGVWYASVDAPPSPPDIESHVRRPHHCTVGDVSLIVVPLGDASVVIGRAGAPGFLPAEVDRATALVAVTAEVSTDLPWEIAS